MFKAQNGKKVVSMADVRRNSATLLQQEVIPAVNQLLVNDTVTQRKVTALETQAGSFDRRLNALVFDVVAFRDMTFRERVRWVMTGAINGHR